jgi:hypothetical protein
MANDNPARDADRAWDSPGSVISYGTRPDLGENRKVAM